MTQSTVSLATRARNVAFMCLNMAAESEKAGQRAEASQWRTWSADCFRIAADHKIENPSLSAKVIRLFE
ncbi:MAG: hypothetical protein GOVbin4933_33 [Prokaryotic dsDNA virus sp.]|nr:MAG: hypothetical protein GOVbin4933_33 [Prokaryotic dsDNA virus sp.]|tara:strand:- start:60 stop:266 length:207 start_codon:yes stop_codon:yes gene_type:complete